MDYVTVHGLALHNRDLETLVPGIGLARDFGDYRLMGGVYDNSYNRTSAYLGGAWLPIALRNLRLGLGGALATGYDHVDSPGIAGLAAELPLTKRQRLQFLAVPPVVDSTSGLVMLYQHAL